MIFLVVLCEAALLFIKQTRLKKNYFFTQKKNFDNETLTKLLFKTIQVENI